MNIVIIHPLFPGRFGPLAELLGRGKNNRVVFITSQKADKNIRIRNVQKVVYTEEKIQGPGIPSAVSVANVLAKLKNKGIVPDLIVGLAGQGTLFHVKDVFPSTPVMGFFEWFHQPETEAPDLKNRMGIRNRNLPILADLAVCDRGICPSGWQESRFPREYLDKLTVIRHGVDTDVFKPAQGNGKFKTDSLDLSKADRIVTYTANILAPYQGFDQFMASLPAILAHKPGIHIVIAGADRVTLGDREGNKTSYRTMIREKIDPDPERVHFIDSLNLKNYRQLLQASSVHVYLESPLVISLSLLEAMACGCLVVTQDCPPVKEIIKDGTNGIFTDFSNPKKISEKICACLDYPSFMVKVKEKARNTIKKHFDLKNNLSFQMKMIESLVKGETIDEKPFG